MVMPNYRDKLGGLRGNTMRRKSKARVNPLLAMQDALASSRRTHGFSLDKDDPSLRNSSLRVGYWPEGYSRAAFVSFDADKATGGLLAQYYVNERAVGKAIKVKRGSDPHRAMANVTSSVHKHISNLAKQPSIYSFALSQISSVTEGFSRAATTAWQKSKSYTRTKRGAFVRKTAKGTKVYKKK